MGALVSPVRAQTSDNPVDLDGDHRDSVGGTPATHWPLLCGNTTLGSGFLHQWPAMRAGALVSVLGLCVAACGARTELIVEEDGGVPLPPPPITCATAGAAVDWSACAAEPIPDPRRSFETYCAQMWDTAGCAVELASFYVCIASRPRVCEATAGPSMISTRVVAHDCGATTEAFFACIERCGAGWSCERSDGVCECAPGSPHAGDACGIYPSSMSPRCGTLCSPCG
jgi:hypothetical protein